jgi:hypothetical protein
VLDLNRAPSKLLSAVLATPTITIKQNTLFKMRRTPFFWNVPPQPHRCRNVHRFQGSTDRFTWTGEAFIVPHATFTRVKIDDNLSTILQVKQNGAPIGDEVQCAPIGIQKKRSLQGTIILHLIVPFLHCVVSLS